MPNNEIHEEVLKSFNYRCALNPSHSDPIIHHIVPRGAGGKDDKENLIPLCYKCHGKIHVEGTRIWRDRLYALKNL